MEDSTLDMDPGGGDEIKVKVGVGVDVDYRRRRHKNKKRTPVQGLCLFCNSNFPRTHPYPLSDKRLSNVPKFRRTFAFLAEELGVNIDVKHKPLGVGGTDKNKNANQPEFSFISEQVPLCSDCLELLEQVNSLFLKLQSVKFQLTNVVRKIRTSVIKSRAISNPIYTEAELENESHFNAFRRQVEEEERPPHPCDLKISLPHVKICRLESVEIDRQTKRNPAEIEESEDEVNDLNFSNLIQEEEDSFNFEEFIIGTIEDDEEDGNDVKPDIYKLNREIKITAEEGVVQSTTEDISNEMLPFEVVVPFECGPDTATISTQIPQEENATTTPIISAVTGSSPHQIPATTTPTARKKRQRTIYPKDVDEDTCKLCSIDFKTQKQLADHYRSNHPGEFPRHCPEHGCEYGALLPNAIRKHIFLKHGPEEAREQKKNMICEECGKRFFASKNLKYHIRMHKDLKPFSCPKCGKKFRCQQAVDVHVFRIHENVRNFHCPHCPWKFKDHVSLKGHIAIHTGEKNYSCHICPNRKFIQHHALKSHWRVHKRQGDWTEPPDFNKRRGGWVKKSRKGQNPTNHTVALQEEPTEPEGIQLSLEIGS